MSETKQLFVKEWLSGGYYLADEGGEVVTGIGVHLTKEYADLFAASSELLEAAKEIYTALENNAAPFKVVYALRQPETKKVFVDKYLLAALCEAVERAEGRTACQPASSKS